MKFNFCIGRFWNGDSGSLCVYRYGSEVHYGTQEDAEKLLEYINNKNTDTYQIFKVGEQDENSQ